MTGYPDNNPKSVIGVTKPQLQNVPPVAVIYMAAGFGDGAIKYGPYNWRENKVAASVYVGAALRHIYQWYDGEEFATDSNVHHMAHAMSCLGIIADGREGGNLIDDRPIPGAASRLITDLTREYLPEITYATNTDKA